MHRGKLDIIANILNLTRKPTLKDHIIRKCSLSNEQFKGYVEILLENGLIDAFPAVNMRHMPGRQNKRRTIFHIAETGKRFLKLYSELSALVDRSATMSFREIFFLPLAKRLEYSSTDKEGEQE